MPIDEYEEASWDGWFSNEVACIRDMLEPILTGEIERGHCEAGEREAYGGKRGMRKTTLADARKIVHHVTIRINRAINRFNDRPND